MALGTKENDSFVLNAGKIKIEHSTEVTLFGAYIALFKSLPSDLKDIHCIFAH